MIKKKIVKKVYLPSNGSKSVSPEKIKVNDLLSITINPDEQFIEFSHDPFERFNLWTAMVYKSLKDIKYCDMVLWPEVSHIGRLHLHGTVNVRSPAEFAISDIPKLIMIGHTDIDTILDMKVWDTYMKKSCIVMEEFTSHNVHYIDGNMSINQTKL